ncbi:hypothetical protein BBJ28_00019133 [Nothophytophthora sp. Chile5]|nr:hypothetical protein BBJ28_00019133 [Nothophytophthora sp. Chile5]
MIGDNNITVCVSDVSGGSSNGDTAASDSKSHVVVIVVPILVAIVVLAAIIGGIFYRKRRTALFEYVENGALRSRLAASPAPSNWTRETLQLAIDVIEALVYVHSFNPPLVHRDMKSRNVLITGEMRAKLTEFGIARFRSEDKTMTTGVGTSRWLAPEVISGSRDYDQSADLFSFGVVLSELDTHTVPYEDAVGPYGHTLQDGAILQMAVTGSLRPTFRSSCPPAVRELALLCMSQDPGARPKAPAVAYTLRTAMKSLS